MEELGILEFLNGSVFQCSALDVQYLPRQSCSVRTIRSFLDKHLVELEMGYSALSK
jgi:hypothetical protein